MDWLKVIKALEQQAARVPGNAGPALMAIAFALRAGLEGKWHG